MAELISKNGNKVSFKVIVPANEVNRAYDQVWRELAKNVQIPGFRPGKAPRGLLEKRVGKDYVQQQVADKLVAGNLDKAVQELELQLVDIKITYKDIVSGKDCELSIIGETYPEVTLGDWKNTELDFEDVNVDEELFERTLQDLRERNAEFEVVERPVEATDQVTVSEENNIDSSYPIYMELADEKVHNALLGKSNGDTVEVHNEEGETIQAQILAVKHKILPELNDEFAKNFELDSLESLRKTLRNDLEERAKNETLQHIREAFVGKLKEGMEADIPNAMIDNQCKEMLTEIQRDLKRQGVDWNEYQEFMEEEERFNQFMNNLQENAKERVMQELALDKLAADLEVKVSEQDLNQMLLNAANYVNMVPQEFVDQIGQEGINSYYINLRREKALVAALAELFPDKFDNTGKTTDNADNNTASEATATETTEAENPEIENKDVPTV